MKKYRIFQLEKCIYKTDSFLKAICYALLIKKNKQLFSSIVCSDDRASNHEFYI